MVSRFTEVLRLHYSSQHQDFLHSSFPLLYAYKLIYTTQILFLRVSRIECVQHFPFTEQIKYFVFLACSRLYILYLFIHCHSKKTWILSPAVSLKSNRSFPPTSSAASSINCFRFTPPKATKRPQALSLSPRQKLNKQNNEEDLELPGTILVTPSKNPACSNHKDRFCFTSTSSEKHTLQ